MTDTLPKMSYWTLPSVNIPGPTNRTLFGRWIELGNYFSKLVERHIHHTGKDEHYVSVPGKNDASIILGTSRILLVG